MVNTDELPRYPSDVCEGSCNHTHHFVRIVAEVFQCKYCGRAKWQPINIIDAVDFNQLVSGRGIEKAYRAVMEAHRGTVAIIKALEVEWKLRRNLDPKTAEAVAERIRPKAYKMQVLTGKNRGRRRKPVKDGMRGI